jgi:protein-disulfide isomerase
VAKSGKKAAAKPEPSKADAAGTDKTWLYIAGAVAAAVLVGAVVYWQSAPGGTGTGEKTDPDLAELMAPGPLPDISLGKDDAPNTIVEYASMTAGPDRYYPMVGALFDTQETWAVPGVDGKEKLLLIAKQAGFSKETFDQCLADKELFQKIVDTRTRANEEFGVDSTPSFFVNGKRLTGEHTLQDFENALGGGTPAADGAASPAGETPSKPEGAAGQ